MSDDPVATAVPGNVSRRRALLGLAGLVAGFRVLPAGAAPPLPPVQMASGDDWRAFAAGFITADGRVVDTGNDGVTHSEGQGYGMLFATHFNDRATFNSVFAWTEKHLRRPCDALYCWRYKPNASVPVDDPNNATDGDLLIAWALLRGGQQWGDRSLTDRGRAIAADLLANCVCKVGDATVLLPAAFGFQHPDRVVINPSYYIFPALDALAAALPGPTWTRLKSDGLRILRRARFGRWQLPADWLEITDGAVDDVAPAQGWPARFSWDAVRVPLNLVWGGVTAAPALGAAADFWGDPRHGHLPAWVDLETDMVAGCPASRGVAAIAAIAHASHTGAAEPNLPHVADAEDYYSAALVLLARIVWRERGALAPAA